MKDNQSELIFENERLEEIISIGIKQLNQERQNNEKNKLDIISAKKELRENTAHSISGLWGSDGFEALADLSQYSNPVMEKMASFEATENKIAILENLIKSPYFARIDFKFDDEDDFEKIYIGRSSLMEGISCKIHVYDWRSPIASIFYRFVMGEAYYDAPCGRITGELNLKRQYEINNGILEYFFDADIQIVDEFLRKLLSKNTSSKMKTIVETIQKEQDIVIRDMENDLMMVQGVAGSGKTSIALHRVAYLMYQGLTSKLSANNIIIISPNSLFEQYISNVLPELGEDNVVSLVFEEIIEDVVKNVHIQSKNQFLEALITSTQYGDIIKNSIELKTSHQFMEILIRFINDLPNNWIKFNDIYYNDKFIVSKEILKNKVLSGRKETPLGLKLNQLEEFIFELIQEQKKNHKGSIENFILKNEIQKFTQINVVDIYRKLFGDKEYFYSLAKGINLPYNMEEIFEFTQENLNSDILYHDDAIVLTFLNLKINGTNEYKNIKQVVIDEAQDYYPLQYEIFKLLFSNSKYTILGDINQTLEKREDLYLYEQIEQILKKKKASLVTMDKSFRCTNEILNFSSKFINYGVDIKSFNRSGDEPKIYVADNQKSLNNMIISEIKHCLKSGYQSIGLICKTEKNASFMFECLKDKIDLTLIKNNGASGLDGVFVIPVYMSKGLEFDSVLICDADIENYNSEDDKKLLYIGCTRALHRLNLFCKGKISLFL